MVVRHHLVYFRRVGWISWWMALYRTISFSHERTIMLQIGTFISQHGSRWEMTSRRILGILTVMKAVMNFSGSGSLVPFTLMVVMIVGWLNMARGAFLLIPTSVGGFFLIHSSYLTCLLSFRAIPLAFSLTSPLCFHGFACR